MARHGEKSIAEKSKDKPLTEKGREQAKFLKERLARESFDEVLVSTYKRALETFDLIKDKLKYKKLTISNDFTEIYDGLVGNPKKSDLKPNEIRTRVKNDKKRLNKTWKTLFQYPYDSKVLMIGHGNFFRWLIAKTLEINPKKTKNIILENCSISIIAVSSDRGKGIYLINDTTHLK